MFIRSKIKRITPIGEKVVCDLTIDGDESYIGNGIVNHNSSKNPNMQNIPRVTTNPDVKKMFVAPPGYLVVECVGEGSWVYTDRGVEPIEVEKRSVLVGQTEYTVRGTEFKGVRKAYKVTTNTGRSLVVTGDHLFKTINGYTPTKELGVGEILYIDTSIVEGEIYTDLLEAYTAGLFYGDGSYSANRYKLNFSTGADRGELLGILNCQFPDAHWVISYKDPVKSVGFHSEKIYLYWKAKYPKESSHDMRIPLSIMGGTIEAKKNFIGGLIDSDGSVNSNRIRFSSVCEAFIDDLLILLNSVGVYGIKVPKYQKTNYGEGWIYHILIYSRSSIRVLVGYPRLKRKARMVEYMAESKGFSQCKTEYIPLAIYRDLPISQKMYRTIKNGNRKGRVTRESLAQLLPYASKQWANIYNYRYELVESVIPIGDTRVWDVIVPGKKEFVANGIVVHNCDYSQAELRIVAELANEEKMITWFKEGHNIHVAVAVAAEEVNTGQKLNYDDIYKITKDESHPKHIEWTKKKKRAKTINFGILYGQGPPKLAETLKCSKEEAAKFLDEWLATFPRIAKWIKRQHRRVKEDGYVVNMWGMKRRLPNIYSSKYGERSEAERQAVNCVDAETEALTLRGWEKWDRLKVGDIILTKNPKTGALEWGPIEYLSIFPDYRGEAYLIENRRKTFSALTTPEHRWLCNPSSKRLDRNVEYLSKDLYKDPSRCIHRTGNYDFPKVPTYTDDLIELLGWVLTDGNLCYYKLPGKPRNGKPHRVTLTQSYRANPHKVKKIQALIGRLKFKVREIDIKETGSYRWVFTKEVADMLDSIIPGKLLNMGLLLTLTEYQANLLLNTMMLGDGSGGRRLCSGDLENVGYFQGLITLLGKCSNIVTRDQIGQKHYGNVRNTGGYVESKNISYKVSILERDKAHTKSTRGDSYIKKLTEYKGLMWCPTVSNSFWVARRKGTTYITGNTPIQGAASFFTLFSAVIIEEYRIQGKIPLDRPMIYTVHDSLGFYVRKDKIHEFVSIAVPICANPQTQEYFHFQMKKVNMKASVELGPSWGELHDYDPKKDYTL